MGWSTLPVELQTIVFQYLLGDQNSLKQLSSVCKGWLSTAQIALYTDVNLTERNLNSFANCISNGSAICGESTVTIQLQHSGDIVDGDMRPITKASLVKIVTYCPNVQLIDINFGVVDQLYEALQMISKNEVWKKLKEIKTYYLVEEIDEQKQLLRIFSDSLENIRFHFHSPPIHIMDDVEYYFLKLCDIANYLKQFSKIKLLELEVGDANADFQQYDALLDELPSTLKDLTLNSSWKTNGQFGREDNDHVFRTITETVKRMDTLEILKTNLPIVNARNIHYILHKFPRLVLLKLANTANSFMGPVAVSYCIPKTILQQIIDRALLMREMDIDRLHFSNESEFLDMLILEKKLVKELVLARKQHYVKSYPPCCLIDFKKRTQCGKNVMSIVSNYFYKTLTYNIQNQFKLIKNYGDKISTLTVDHSEDKDPNFRPEDCPYIMNSILGHCPLLETLIFKGVNLEYHGLLDVSTVNQNDSIKTLVLTSSTRTSKETFHFLSQRLPALEELNFEIPIDNCCMEKEFAGCLRRKNQVIIDMPFNQFERIKIHFYDLYICYNRLCFIKLTTGDTIRHFVCFGRYTRKCKNLLVECPEAVFQDYLSKKKFQRVPYFIIKCKSLKQLQFISKKAKNSDPINRICNFPLLADNKK